MLVHPQFDPVAVSLGPLSIHWYGLMYLAGFLSGLLLGRYRAKQSFRGWKPAQVDDILFYIVIGIVLGGRVGYVLFYQFDLFLENPLYLLKIWEGGMSFHGGFLGVCLAVILFARRNNMALGSVADFVAPLVPLGIAFGRFGNFINGELWGHPTDVPWAMVFPQIDDLARHPSQLYQFAGEGLLLFASLWWFTSKPRPRWSAVAFFLMGYGVFRILAEFFREPDAHLGFLAFDFLTMGMLLSVPMILVGVVLMVWSYRTNRQY